MTHHDNKRPDFKRDLSEGKKQEYKIANMLGVSLEDSQPKDRRLGDICYTTPSGTEVIIESKLEFKFDATGNIVLELADTHALSSTATGVAKNILTNDRVLYVHGLGTTGDFLVYDALEAFHYMENMMKGGFLKIVSVFNKKSRNPYHTVSLIQKPHNLPFALRISSGDLKNAIDGWKFKEFDDRAVSPERVKRVYTQMFYEFGVDNNPEYFKGNLVVKPVRGQSVESQESTKEKKSGAIVQEDRPSSERKITIIEV